MRVTKLSLKIEPNLSKGVIKSDQYGDWLLYSCCFFSGNEHTALNVD